MKGIRWAYYSSAWRVVTRIVTDYFFYHEDISFVTRRITDDLFVPNYRIIEFFFTRRIADGHGGFLWHETFTLDILTNGKEFAN